MSTFKQQSKDGRLDYHVQCLSARACSTEASKLCPGGIDLHPTSTEHDMRFACHAPVRKPRVQTVKLVAASRPMIDTTASSAGRRACTKVIVLGPDQKPDKTEDVFGLIERELIRDGVGVVSAAVTARVDESEARTRTVVERAVILARDSGADCLVQVDIGVQAYHRYFVFEQGEMTEKSQVEFDQTPDAFRWAINGRGLELNAKVIDVQTVEVLAAIHLQSSDVDSAYSEDLQTIDGRLAPRGGHNATWVSERADLGYNMIRLLVEHVRGTH